jgi:hypothetical protein
VHHRPLRLRRARPSLGAARSILVLAGVASTLALAVFATQLGSAPAAQAAGLRYHSGYSAQSGWLCYGWSSGLSHCTHHWHSDASGRLISDNPAWVPNGGASAGPATEKSSARWAPTNASAGAARPGTQAIVNAIESVFGGYGDQAVRVARCESGLNPNAYNASSGASGLFQLLRSTWSRTSYAGQSPFNADANIHAAHEVFTRDGNSWREWSCKP